MSPSPAAEATPRPFDPKLDIGVVLAGIECSELLIRNTELKPDDEIQVVVWEWDKNPHKKLLAKIVGGRGCPRSSQSGIEQVVVAEDESSPNQYEIRFRDGDYPDSGFGVITVKATVQVVDGVAQITASNVRSALLFRVCSRNESYHMTVWEGKPLVGKRVWYSYMHLLYGTDPTCKPADFK